MQQSCNTTKDQDGSTDVRGSPRPANCQETSAAFLYAAGHCAALRSPSSPPPLLTQADVDIQTGTGDSGLRRADTAATSLPEFGVFGRVPTGSIPCESEVTVLFRLGSLWAGVVGGRALKQQAPVPKAPTAYWTACGQPVDNLWTTCGHSQPAQLLQLSHISPPRANTWPARQNRHRPARQETHGKLARSLVADQTH